METPVKVSDPRFIKFPSIYDFHRVIRKIKERAAFRGLDANDNPIYDQAPTYPVYTFRGTVKVHGSNAAITKVDGEINFQSRDNLVTPEKDHMGLAAHFNDQTSQRILSNMFDDIGRHLKFDLGRTDTEGLPVAIFGEWCGDKIQTKASIAVLPKMFVIVKVKVGEEWLDMDKLQWLCAPVISIFNIGCDPEYLVTVDFSRPELTQEKMRLLTLEVEQNCPFARRFGIENGIGEGLVWSCVEDPSSDYWFKIKGQKHSNTNIKLINAVDTDARQALYNFCEAVVQEPRLDQAFQKVIVEQERPFTQQSMGDFIRWIYADVLREEEDLIKEHNIDPEEMGKPISDICKKWYIGKMRSQ